MTSSADEPISRRTGNRRDRGTSAGCDQHLDPLPWVALGLALLAGGLAAPRLRRR